MSRSVKKKDLDWHWIDANHSSDAAMARWRASANMSQDRGLFFSLEGWDFGSKNFWQI